MRTRTSWRRSVALACGSEPLVDVGRDASAEFGEPVAAWLEIQRGIAEGSIRLGDA